MQKTVAVNEAGLRIGEDHPKAELTDAEVERVRILHEDGWSYKQLAEKFDQSRGAIAKICQYKRRSQTVAGFKRVPVSDCE